MLREEKKDQDGEQSNRTAVNKNMKNIMKIDSSKITSRSNSLSVLRKRSPSMQNKTISVNSYKHIDSLLNKSAFNTLIKDQGSGSIITKSVTNFNQTLVSES